MDWTTNQPTQEGNYWAEGDGTTFSVRVVRHGKQLRAIDHAGRLRSMGEFQRWLGPVEDAKPADPRQTHTADPRDAQPL